MYPSLQQSENARLWEVSNHQHLDKFYAEMLQELVDTASISFDIPIVYISFIEEFRQVLTAKKGAYPDEIRREDSFCQYLLQKKSPLIINNTLQENKFRISPLVTHYPKIRFYAGAPVISKKGFTLGSFCVCDTQFRHFTAQEEQKLVDFSRQASDILELNRLYLATKNIYPNQKMVRPATSLSGQYLQYNSSTCINKSGKIRFENNNCSEIINIKSSDYKKTSMTTYNPDGSELSGEAGSKVLEWGNTILKKHTRKEYDINLSKFIKGLNDIMDYKLKERGNSFKWNISDNENWYGDEKILKFICSNLLDTLNERNMNSTLTTDFFDTEDYSLFVLRYNGIPILRSELDWAFKSMPASDDPLYKQGLYFCWHTMRLLGGFITVPENTKQGNYITVAFPKKLNRGIAA